MSGMHIHFIDTTVAYGHLTFETTFSHKFKQYTVPVIHLLFPWKISWSSKTGSNIFGKWSRKKTFKLSSMGTDILQGTDNTK